MHCYSDCTEEVCYLHVGFNVQCYSDCTEEVSYLHVRFNVHCYSDCTEEVSFLQGCAVLHALLLRMYRGGKLLTRMCGSMCIVTQTVQRR